MRSLANDADRLAEDRRKRMEERAATVAWAEGPSITVATTIG